MSPTPVSNLPARKSFAQVAAAGNATLFSKSKNVNNTNQNSTNEASTNLQNGSVIVSEDTEANPIGNDNSIFPVTKQIVVEHDEKGHQLAGLLQAVHLQDGLTPVSTSDHLLKKESDTKSVASRTTLTLDEKESLRPDDSASMQAAPEEDAFSPSGSVVAGSREGSDPDARAFRDQLQVIDQTSGPGLASQGRPADVTAPNADHRNGGIIYPSATAIAKDFNIPDAVGVDRVRGPPVGLIIPPDEKLLEALASPKDRLFVLKVEQDMIDFVRDSKEEFLQLPQTNSFYRMLSHKLADYYLLGHLIDESMTSVRIFRTPNSRLPPPLMGSSSSADGSTPPPTALARKIMRRGGDGNQRGSASNNLNSETSFKATSNVEAGSGGDDDVDNKSKDKFALTREEREALYKEARARIFKDFKETEAIEGTEAAAGANDKDPSRSSSTSGVKKGRKNKKAKDDGFEARSVYYQHGNEPFTATGLSSTSTDGAFFNPFAQYAVVAQVSSPNRSFEDQAPAPPPFSPFGPQNSTNLGSWPGQIPAHGYMMPQSQIQPPYQGGESFDNLHQFPAGHHSFPSPNTASQATPRMAAPPLAGYKPEYSQSDGMSWSQNVFNNSYAPTMMYNGNNGNNNGFLDSTFGGQQMMCQQLPSAYGSFQSQDHQFYAQQSAFNNFSRQQFNPRSQTFVPAPPLRGDSMQSPSGSMPPNMSWFPNGPTGTPFQRQTSDASQGSGYNPAVQYGQPSPSGNRINGHYSLPRPSIQAQNVRITPQQQSFSNSISKWGSPATLPPKPPPPAISSPYFEVPKDPQNQQPLPPNPYSSMARSANNNQVSVHTPR